MAIKLEEVNKIL